MNTVFRGIFLTSEHPTETVAFYRQVAGIELEEVGSSTEYRYWKIDRREMQLAIHDARLFSDYTHPVCTASNTTHLYFRIANRSAFLDHLKTFDIEPYRVDDVVVTVIDPDGRKVMFGTA